MMMNNQPLRRTIHPVVKVLDAKQGLVEYVASDETVDSYKEVIRASGWRFTNFAKNAPFVDSHDYSSIEKLLGKVVDFRVDGRSLVETVQWAKDAGNKLADIGWRMTEGGFLKAVSVGFWPVKYITKADSTYAAQLKELNIEPMTEVRTIFTEQEQIELSAVVIGANPNALARSYKAGYLTDADLDMISCELAKRETVSVADDPAYAALAQRLAQTAFLEKLNRAIGAQ
jgi:hypothetical protein